jgi:hypothetical protein
MHRQLLKLILVCLTTMLCDNPCLAQEEFYNNLKAWHIKGDVDSILNNQYMVAGGDSTIRENGTWYVSYYNKEGLLSQNHYYPYNSDKMGFDMKDPRSIRNINHYDGNGELSDKTNYDEQGQAYTKDVYTFDPSGISIELKHYYLPKQSLIYIKKLSLDIKGNVIGESVYDFFGKLENKYRYKYNADNYCIEKVAISVDGFKEYKTLFTYNNGDLIKEIQYDDVGKVLTTYVYQYPKYDEKHNWVIKRNYINGRLFQINERVIIYRK